MQQQITAASLTRDHQGTYNQKYVLQTVRILHPWQDLMGQLNGQKAMGINQPSCRILSQEQCFKLILKMLI